MEHVSKLTGTPKRPQTYVEGFIFAMFNENLKPDGVEQNFGLFYPSMDPVYSVFPPKLYVPQTVVIPYAMLQLTSLIQELEKFTFRLDYKPVLKL
ncbi:hypothetical protein RJ639_032482 [Escallonia herrerae]|uniref:Uncharacterized protein n=1 Tax=Escallonia herrerae TaxID=1293975 RepID=A0AA88X086_9ASTE|nr:hypothetical protein RJ639_032482 [Escallonia herrerae]